jgi:hypothetical protein
MENVSEGLPPMPPPKRKRPRPDGMTVTVGLTIRLLSLAGVVLVLDQPRWVQVSYAVVVLIAAFTWWWKDGR